MHELESEKSSFPDLLGRAGDQCAELHEGDVRGLSSFRRDMGEDEFDNIAAIKPSVIESLNTHPGIPERQPLEMEKELLRSDATWTGGTSSRLIRSIGSPEYYDDEKLPSDQFVPCTGRPCAGRNQL